MKAVVFCLLTHIPWALPSFALCSWHTSLFSCFHPYSLLVLNAEDVCPKSGRGLLCMVLACSPGWTGHGGAHKKRLFGSLRQTDLNQGDGCLSGGLTRRAACFGFQGSLCTVAWPDLWVGAMLRQNVQEVEEVRAETTHSTVGAEKGSNW